MDEGILLGSDTIFQQRWRRAITTRRALVQVCHTWYTAGVGLLYASFMARNLVNVIRFTSTIRKNNVLGGLVRRAMFVDLSWFKPDPTSWITSTRVDAPMPYHNQFMSATRMDRSLELFLTLASVGNLKILEQLRVLAISAETTNPKHLVQFFRYLPKMKLLEQLHFTAFAFKMQELKRFPSSTTLPNLRHLSLKITSRDVEDLKLFLSGLRCENLLSLAILSAPILGDAVRQVLEVAPNSIYFLSINNAGVNSHSFKPVSLPRLRVLRISMDTSHFQLPIYITTFPMEQLHTVCLTGFANLSRARFPRWATRSALEEVAELMRWAAKPSSAPNLVAIVFKISVGELRESVTPQRWLEEFESWDTLLRRRGLCLSISTRDGPKPFNMDDFPLS